MQANINQMNAGLYDEAEQIASILTPIIGELVEESSRRHGDPATGISVGATALVYLAIGLSDSLDVMTNTEDKAAKKELITAMCNALNARITKAAYRQNGGLN